MQIYNRLAVLRAERGWSRQQVAESVGVHAQTVGFIERGDYFPSLELAFKLARLFDLPVEAIFKDEPFTALSDIVYKKDKEART